MKDIDLLIKKAETYKQYIQGLAYIPLQDVPIYEKAFNAIYCKT